MKHLGIIQPGRIGDVIICLPIAKWYYDMGYKIIWPVADYVFSNFDGYIEYVQFLPIKNLDCAEARSTCINKCNTVIDLTFTLPNSNSLNDNLFFSNKIQFDQLKYKFANVPFCQKWKLEFTRNSHYEDKLIESLNLDGAFTLLHRHGSSESFEYKPEPNESLIEVGPISRSILDWCAVLERANKVVAIDSCFSNLVEQTNYKGPKYLVRRSADFRPTYKNWIVF